MRRTMRRTKDAVKMMGFFRLQIEDGPTKKIVGDSGWRKNIVVNPLTEDDVISHVDVLVRSTRT